MILEEERKKIIEISLVMLEKKLTNGTSGNISYYDREKKIIAITPTGIPYKLLKPSDITLVNIDGKIIEGKKPTSELEMHLINYRNREDINAIIHAHTIYATAISCLRIDLPAIDYMIAVAGGKEVSCAKYATYETKELAENAYEAMKGKKAVLLANHGINTAANDLDNALNIMEQIEYIAQLYILSSQIGKPVVLDNVEMTNMLTKFENYGKIQSEQLKK